MKSKEMFIRILIAIGCMIGADIVHYFIQYNMIYFIFGAMYMGISENRSQSNKDSNTITFTNEEIEEIGRIYNLSKLEDKKCPPS